MKPTTLINELRKREGKEQKRERTVGTFADFEMFLQFLVEKFTQQTEISFYKDNRILSDTIKVLCQKDHFV